MEEKRATLSHDYAVTNGKESLDNTENKSLESQDVQAADDEGALGSGEGSGSGATSKENVIEKKRGRGRPRKYENGVPIINGSMEAFPIPAASSSKKRARGRPKGTGKFQALASVGGYMDTAGGSFNPHVLLVYAGEDLVNKIASFCARASRSVCILTASGAVSSVTLCKPGTSTGTLTYEGRFEILSLTGSSVVSGEVGSRRKTGLLSVSLANSHGQVFGGSIAGPLIAAGPGPIQLIVASFKQNIGRQIRRKYSAATSTSANIFASSEEVNVPSQVTGMADDGENCAPPPVPITVSVTAFPAKADSMKSDNVVAENHNFNSTCLQTVSPNNLQKADPLREENVIAENHGLKSTSPQTFGPDNLQTLPVSQPISDEMITLNNNASVPEMHVKD
ncbi:AT-hook motif nuclear-localized protein 11-like [Durio zibethinus]|uniref:AT-hook motif nuclear-localized protein n=1 Tax=Durio zibethinus TaxID=66656 RepID=A0A6P5XQZ3_DURZI|nr:AT-hook motif nuclear-localized protein 11-like [Durio zibethinus]